MSTSFDFFCYLYVGLSLSSADCRVTERSPRGHSEVTSVGGFKLTEEVGRFLDDSEEGLFTGDELFSSSSSSSDSFTTTQPADITQHAPQRHII